MLIYPKRLQVFVPAKWRTEQHLSPEWIRCQWFIAAAAAGKLLKIFEATSSLAATGSWQIICQFLLPGPLECCVSSCSARAINGRKF